MARTRRNRLHVQLAVDYYEDDLVIEAGEKAELLFVRILAFCKKNWETDGVITDGQLTRAAGAGLTAIPSRAKRLVDVGLLERAEVDLLGGGKGYRVSGWLKWNPSADEIRTTRRADSDRKRGQK